MRLLNRLRRWVPGLPSNEPPLSAAYDSWRDWQSWLAEHEGRLDAQYRLQCEVGAAVGKDGWPGWCGLCSRSVYFALPSAAGGALANLREELVCPGCRLTSRNRAALSLLVHDLSLSESRFYLTEQASTAFVWLQAVCARLEGSEFGLDERSRARLQSWFEQLGGKGELVERDVTRLDFPDGSLDAFGTVDVLEHVPDYPAALREFSRCLRRGGRLVVTVPFLEKSPDTRIRARLDAAGQIEHLLEPEIHGDPVAGGVLCFYHFGWDLLDACRAAGFSRASWVRTWSPREAMFGLWTLVATR